MQQQQDHRFYHVVSLLLLKGVSSWKQINDEYEQVVDALKGILVEEQRYYGGWRCRMELN
jgi:hypothetical protein